MENYSTNTFNPGPIYHKNYLSPCVDPSFKVDEGYSEETRSQDDVDSPMRLDSASNEMKTIPVPMVASLPEGIMALNEAERSGMLPHLSVRRSVVERRQISCTMYCEH